jgi:hypothetical protein
MLIVSAKHRKPARKASKAFKWGGITLRECRDYFRVKSFFFTGGLSDVRLVQVTAACGAGLRFGNETFSGIAEKELASPRLSSES